MIQCCGQVRSLPAPADGKKWQLFYAEGSGIPFVSDGVTKKWAMQLFQEDVDDPATAPKANAAPELDLNKVGPGNPTPSTAAPGGQQVTPTPPMPGLSGGWQLPNICQVK